MSGESELTPANLHFTLSSPDTEPSPLLNPIVFIHGFFSTNSSWNAVKCSIANQTKRKVYVLDLRNHGKSEWTDEFTVYHMVTDVENFMKTQGISRAVFVGHSMGGRVTMALALKKPVLVESLVVEDIPLTDTPGQVEIAKKVIPFFQTLYRTVGNLSKDMSESEMHRTLRAMIGSFFPQIADNFAKENKFVTLPVHKDRSGRIVWEANMPVLFEYNENRKSFQIDLSRHPVFDGKMLLLVGDKSEMQAEDDWDNVVKHFPRAELYTFQGGYHTYHAEFPSLFIKVVSEFIAG